MKNIVTIIIFVVAFLSLKAQTVDTSIIKDTLERNYYTRFNNFNFLKMDKIRDCNISFCVLGEVELDSLIIVNYQYNVHERIKKGWFYVTHATPVTGNFITFERNIPLIASTPPEELHKLFQRHDVFKWELEVYLIKYSIIPQCYDDTLKIKLTKITESQRFLEQIKIKNRTNNFVYLYNDKGNCSEVCYEKIIGNNKYVLLLMNRTWEESADIWHHDPPKERDTTNMYVKYLIPLY